ncbi:hypothetical protein TU76_08615 [Pseudomonas psychrophila]|nr:hypothetical protein TU76_08615 [Pseudomonas psychrophila]
MPLAELPVELTATEPLPEAEAEAQSGPAAELQQDPVVDPQQWLNMMLSQQNAQVQAREVAAPAVQAVSGERLLARMASHTAQEPVAARDSNRMAPVSGQARTPSELPVDGLAMMLEKRDAPAVRMVMPVMSAASEGVSLAVTATLEALSGTEGAAAPAPAPLTPAPQTSGPVLERGLKLAEPQARWGEQMLHALRETVEVQVQQRFQQATIRLDPPELGSLEIFISHESGRLSVHISAAQTDVARLLAATSERLRQELVEQNSLQVNVQVSSDSRGHSSRDQGRSARESAIADADAVQDGQAPADLPTQRDNGVLVTV